PNLYWRSADGSGPEERLTTSDHLQGPQSFSPDGKLLAFFDMDPSTGYDLWILPLEGDRKPFVFLKTPFNEHQASVSPDGKWIAYTSNESGRDEVYVASYPGPGGRVQISTDGGVNPVWSPGGHELFYRKGEKMLAVLIETKPELVVGRPSVLFEGKFEEGYDVARARQRVVMVGPSGGEGGPTATRVVAARV